MTSAKPQAEVSALGDVMCQLPKFTEWHQCCPSGTKVSVLVASSSTCCSFPWVLCRTRASWSRRSWPSWHSQSYSTAKLIFPVITSSLLLLLPLFSDRWDSWMIKHKVSLPDVLCGSKYWSIKSEIPTVLGAKCSPFCMMSLGFWFGRVSAFWVVWRSPSPLASEWPFFQSNWPYPLFF